MARGLLLSAIISKSIFQKGIAVLSLFTFCLNSFHFPLGYELIICFEFADFMESAGHFSFREKTVIINF